MLGDILCHVKWCQSTSLSDHNVVQLTAEQRDRAMPLRHADKLRDATSCRGTAQRHVGQRNRAMPRRLADRLRDAHGAERQRNVTLFGGTARRHVVKRPRGTTWCREHAIDQRALWTSVGQTGCALPTPPHTVPAN